MTKAQFRSEMHRSTGHWQLDTKGHRTPQKVTTVAADCWLMASLTAPIVWSLQIKSIYLKKCPHQIRLHSFVLLLWSSTQFRMELSTFFNRFQKNDLVESLVKDFHLLICFGESSSNITIFYNFMFTINNSSYLIIKWSVNWCRDGSLIFWSMISTAEKSSSLFWMVECLKKLALIEEIQFGVNDQRKDDRNEIIDVMNR